MHRAPPKWGAGFSLNLPSRRAPAPGAQRLHGENAAGGADRMAKREPMPLGFVGAYLVLVEVAKRRLVASLAD